MGEAYQVWHVRQLCFRELEAGLFSYKVRTQYEYWPITRRNSQLTLDDLAKNAAWMGSTIFNRQ